MKPARKKTVAAGPAHQVSLRRVPPRRSGGAMGKCRVLFAMAPVWVARRYPVRARSCKTTSLTRYDNRRRSHFDVNVDLVFGARPRGLFGRLQEDEQREDEQEHH